MRVRNERFSPRIRLPRMLMPILWSRPVKLGFTDITSNALGVWAWATNKQTVKALTNRIVISSMYTGGAENGYRKLNRRLPLESPSDSHARRAKIELHAKFRPHASGMFFFRFCPDS